MKNINELCLFIGGPADGRRIAIPDAQHYVKYPTRSEVHSYRDELFAGAPAMRIRIFISEEMTTGEALERLVERYLRC